MAFSFPVMCHTIPCGPSSDVLGQMLPEEKEKGAFFLESPVQGSWGFSPPPTGLTFPLEVFRSS